MKSAKTDRLLRAAIGLLLVALVYVDLRRASTNALSSRAIRRPDFTITTDNGRTVSLPNFGGKLLVLNFWATWCPPCVQETPSLSRFAADYAPKGVVVLGVSVDKDEKAYNAFLRALQARLPDRPRYQDPRGLRHVHVPGDLHHRRPGQGAQKLAEPADWMDPRMTKLIDSLL